METKQKRTKAVVSVLVLAGLVVFALTAIGGNLEPSGSPGPTMHTLEDIYGALTGGSEPPPQLFAAYIKYDGIDGGSTDLNHIGWSDVATYTFTADRLREAIAPDRLELSVVKRLDQASPMLAQYCPGGTHITSVELDVCPSEATNETFMKYTLTDATVSGVHMYVGADDPLPMEEISFNFAQIQWEYTTADGNSIQTGWDVDANCPITPPIGD